MDACMYHKINGSKLTFLGTYVDIILLASDDIGLLYETKKFLIKNFKMKDLGDVLFCIKNLVSKYPRVITKELYREDSCRIFWHVRLIPGDTPIVKGHKLGAKFSISIGYWKSYAWLSNNASGFSV